MKRYEIRHIPRVEGGAKKFFRCRVCQQLVDEELYCLGAFEDSEKCSKVLTGHKDCVKSILQALANGGD